MHTNPIQNDQYQLLAAQLSELSLRERTSVFLAVPAVLTMAWAHNNSVPVTSILAWMSYMIVVMLGRLKAAQVEIKPGRGAVNLALRRNFRILLSSLYGLGWGMMMFTLNTHQLDFLFILKFATLAAVLGITVNVMCVLLPVYVGLIAPLALTLTAFIFSGESYLQGQARVTLFVGVLVYTALLLASAIRMAKLTAMAFEHGFERDVALRDAKESHQRELAMRERLAVLAQHDDLTGAFNRRHLARELERHVQLLQRHKGDFSVLLIDLDHFKNVNDTYGHPVGDLVLIGVTNLVSSSLREIDIFGRWGGEEFLCILPNTLREEAVACAERLRRGLENVRLVSGHPELIVTASFGLVICHEQQDAEDIMVKVDAALYQAKSGGRNQVKSAV